MAVPLFSGLEFAQAEVIGKGAPEFCFRAPVAIPKTSYRPAPTRSITIVLDHSFGIMESNSNVKNAGINTITMADASGSGKLFRSRSGHPEKLD